MPTPGSFGSVWAAGTWAADTWDENAWGGVSLDRAGFVVDEGAFQRIRRVAATDIDSSGGQTIRNERGTISNTVNWVVTRGGEVVYVPPAGVNEGIGGSAEVVSSVPGGSALIVHE